MLTLKSNRQYKISIYFGTQKNQMRFTNEYLHQQQITACLQKLNTFYSLTLY